jgi:hypothetical protein
MLEKILDCEQYTFLGTDQANVLEFLVIRLVEHGWVENLVAGFQNLVCVTVPTYNPRHLVSSFLP